MDFPQMIRIRQKFESRAISDIPREISKQVRQLPLENRIRPNQRVAIACSSRGIAHYGLIIQSVVSSIKRLGLKPFIIPAMGSHGSATAEGQKAVLENLEVSQEKCGAPVRSSLEVEPIGVTKEGIPVLIDRLASEADFIVPVNRIKRHTDFEGEIESGVMKIMVIGLGKQKGAEVYHQAMYRYGYERVILSVARKVIESGRILFGVGIIEDAFAQSASIHVLKPQELEKREKELLVISKESTPGLPFDDVDVLVIDEMGKDISGSGFETKVVGRIGLPLISKEPETPRVKRIVVCNLTDKTEGNAAGVGIADLITRRLADKIDMESTNMNCLTSGDPEGGKIPIIMENDKEAIQMAIQCVGKIPKNKLRMIRIKNTLHLDVVEVSTAYKEDLGKRQDLELISEEEPMAFDEKCNLKPFTTSDI